MRKSICLALLLGLLVYFLGCAAQAPQKAAPEAEEKAAEVVTVESSAQATEAAADVGAQVEDLESNLKAVDEAFGG